MVMLQTDHGHLFYLLLFNTISRRLTYNQSKCILAQYAVLIFTEC